MSVEIRDKISSTMGFEIKGQSSDKVLHAGGGYLELNKDIMSTGSDIILQRYEELVDGQSTFVISSSSGYKSAYYIYTYPNTGYVDFDLAEDYQEVTIFNFSDYIINTSSGMELKEQTGYRFYFSKTLGLWVLSGDFNIQTL